MDKMKLWRDGIGSSWNYKQSKAKFNIDYAWLLFTFAYFFFFAMNKSVTAMGLSIDEYSLVSGGEGLRPSIGKVAADGTAGSIIGGFIGNAGKSGALNGARIGGGLGIAASAGWEIGTALYKNKTIRNTSIGIIENIDIWTNGRLSGTDKSGNHYDGTDY
ncbi:Uncharacterised protein [Kingella potus]|uniref:Uncharacterized protein n=1 Tax=Kingella potus TaxID=265175 RepID=A0A377R224_9NEIS|nr:hypothetical protein [Kingella potus]STR02807.1 Uncharacterised protein [Kingella potus]